MQLRYFIGLLATSVVLFAHAQTPVRIERAAKLFAQPTERASVLAEAGSRTTFRALEQSADRKWVYVSDGLRYGWIRKVFLRVIDESSAAVSEMQTKTPTPESVVAADPTGAAAPKLNATEGNLPSDLPTDESDADDDPVPSGGGPEDSLMDELTEDDLEIYLVRVPGTFYELPQKNTQKYGKLEPNDQVELLKTSEDSRWVRVRLTETGEEGWIPKVRIGRKVSRSELKALEAPSGKIYHLGISGVMAPEPWGMGVQGFIRRGFSSLAIGTIPVEIGLGGGMNIGMVDSYLGDDIAVTYVDLRLFAHWEPLLSARVGLPIQLGLLYKYGIIETELTAKEFDKSGTRVMEGEAGGFLGLGLTYFVFNSFRLEVIPQIQFTSSVDLVLNAGGVISF